MFDPKVLREWQSVTPSDQLKERVLATAPEKTVAFPGRRITRLAGSLAACLILGFVLLRPAAPGLTVNGRPADGPLVLEQPGAVSRQVVLALEEPDTVTLTLEADGKTDLRVSGGTLEVRQDCVLWTAEAPGPHTLEAEKHGRVRRYTLTRDGQTGLWTLTPMTDTDNN